MARRVNAEERRLREQREGRANWRLFGPYLAERAWGTVREDYSADGEAWEYFPFEHAHLRTYRFGEDGLGGICDEKQRLCFAMAFWNGCDAILKERAFGLSGKQGNHGEDVKEYYFNLDATPTHSYLRYLYKYPQREFPYRELVDENRRRGRKDPSFHLLDTGVFQENRYFDIEVVYAKADPKTIHILVTATNRGPEAAPLHLLPTLWFRNVWSWGNPGAPRPYLQADSTLRGAVSACRAVHPDLGAYLLYVGKPSEWLFTENESNSLALWGTESLPAFTKDAIHRRVIAGDRTSVNPENRGTKCAAWWRADVAPGASVSLPLVFSSQPMERPFDGFRDLLARRREEAETYYEGLLPSADPEEKAIFRQALAGMIWNKQFYDFNVDRWFKGDGVPPPPERRAGRNHAWRHFDAREIISMPDTWEYPWFAAWDLAYQAETLALCDIDFAKDQVELLLGDRYLHPNGQIPAYEWAFGDANPPLTANAALRLYRFEADCHGVEDRNFLQRVFHKLLLNYSWWLNRKDKDGRNAFEGGFLGLDNISVYNRSEALPPGYSLRQADATGWMAMYALNLTVMALELTREDPDYEGIAIQCFRQFQAIAHAMAGGDEENCSLYDERDGFFKDVVLKPNGESTYIDAYSFVGLIPLFASEVVGPALVSNAPAFRDLLASHKGGLFRGRPICACPDSKNEQGERLFALVNHEMLPKILARLLDPDQFFSRYGVRSLSKWHQTRQDLGFVPGIGRALIDYEPGEAAIPMFGGNSNWRGPIWIPLNYSLIAALRRYHRYLGNAFRVVVPGEDRPRHLGEVADLISERLLDLYRRTPGGEIPALRENSPFQSDPSFKDLFLFYEYFHAETGRGLGACHQTGWTGLLANLLWRKGRRRS